MTNSDLLNISSSQAAMLQDFRHISLNVHNHPICNIYHYYFIDEETGSAKVKSLVKATHLVNGESYNLSFVVFTLQNKKLLYQDYVHIVEHGGRGSNLLYSEPCRVFLGRQVFPLYLLYLHSSPAQYTPSIKPANTTSTKK